LKIFGHGLDLYYRIHYQPHLCPLWVRGLICGFISRVEAEAILENASRGAFIIRFSEQCPGQFAIAYVPIDDNPSSNGPFGAMANMGGNTSTGQGRVRHYLLQRDDIFGAKKRLQTFWEVLEISLTLYKSSITLPRGEFFNNVIRMLIFVNFIQKEERITLLGMKIDSDSTTNPAALVECVVRGFASF